MSKTIYLFTDKYPYDEGEQYLENEIRFLSDRFDRIIIFPQTRAQYQRPLPANAEIHFLEPEVRYQKSLLFKNMLLFIGTMFTEFKHGRKNLRSFSHLKGAAQQFYNALCHAEAFAAYLRQHPADNAYFYSYWFYQWSTMLAILKAKGVIPMFVSRAHLGDLYPVFESRPNYLKAFRLKHINQLFPCSEHGSKYLRATYPAFANKVSTAYLGVKQLPDNPHNPDALFTVVSCSAVDNKRKRVDLIADSLAKVDFPLHWIHFGHGVDLEKLREKCKTLPSNITVSLQGFVSNSEVLAFYRTTPVHAFINLSRYEGLPVSMMEAAAAGIPLIGTTIFGVPEILDDTNGFLLPETPTPDQVAACISFIQKAGAESAGLRQGAKAMYARRFSDEKNYNAFIDSLLKH